VMLVKAGDGKSDFKDFEDWAASVQGTWDLDGMTPDEYFEWLRGPRDDLDPR